MTINIAPAAWTFAQQDRHTTGHHGASRASSLTEIPVGSTLWTATRNCARLIVASIALFSLPVFAQTVPLGTATSFGVIAYSTVTNTGATTVTGDLGLTPGTSVTGFPPGAVIGTVHVADAIAVTAKNDAQTAYNTLGSRPCTTTFTNGQDIGGLTLAPGVYCSASTLFLTGTLTLDAQGDSSAVFIFKVGSAFTTASGSQVLMIGGGQSCNIFWQIGSSATLGTTTSFLGNILSLASVTLNTGAVSTGRLIALNGAVTLSSSTVTVCGLAPGNPLLTKSFSPSTINAGAASVLTVTLINPNPTIATLNSPLIDTLPSGVVIANPPNAGTTCAGTGLVSAVAGGNSVSLGTGATIPANGFCTVSVAVTAFSDGIYVNTLDAGALVTTNGNNPAPALATLTVGLVTAATVPTLSTWAVLMSMMLVLVIGVMAQRRRVRQT